MLRKKLLFLLGAVALVSSLTASPSSAALPYCYSSCPLYGGSEQADCWCLNRVPTTCADWYQCSEYWG